MIIAMEPRSSAFDPGTIHAATRPASEVRSQPDGSEH